MKNKIMNVFDTTTKKVLAVILVVIIFVGAGIGIYALTSDNEKFTLEVKKEPLVLEYGTTIATDAKEYLVYSTDQEKYIKNVKVEITVDNQEGKEYPAIGKYDVKLSYDKQKVVTTVEIKDTKAPMFNETNEVSFEQATDFDYTSVIKAEDLQEIEYSFDTINVNKDVTGEYVAKAIVKDKSGNEATKDIKVIVTAKPVVETPKVDTSTNNNGASSSSGSNAVSKPNSNTTKPSTGGNANGSGQGDSWVVPAPDPSVPPPADHKHVNTYDNKYFTTDTEAEAWAENYIFSDENFYGTKYSGYGVNYCSCGLHGIGFY